MIKNGRPYTSNIQYDDNKSWAGEVNRLGEPIAIDAALITDLTEEQQAAVFLWIDEHIKPIKTINRYRTSYGLKHLMSAATGIYVTNNQFKDALLLKGYEPVNACDLNWRYRISERYIKNFERNAQYDV